MKEKLATYLVLAFLWLFAGLANVNGQLPTPTPRPPIPPQINAVPLYILRTEPEIPVANQTMRVYFSATNNPALNKLRKGIVQGKIRSGAVTVTSDEKRIENFQSGSKVEGFLTVEVPANSIGGTIEIYYYEITGTIYDPIRQRYLESKKKITTAMMDFSAFLDADKDGINDRIERDLLEKFRPYYKFSNDKGDENYRPTDVWWYATKSELLTAKDENKDAYLPIETLKINPNAVLTANTSQFGKSDLTKSDLTKMTSPTSYYLNPKENIAGESESNPGRQGNSWNQVKAEKNTGFYGHVVPVKLTNPYKFNFDHILSGSDDGETYYKIEYWQFFGYNDTKAGLDIGDHEGDWTSVQLIYDPKNNNIKSVFHFAHGLSFRYDITPQNNARQVVFTDKDGEIKEYRGLNYDYNSSSLELSYLNLGTVPPRIEKNYQQIEKAQNRLVRFFKNPQTGEFTHPIVYIENGSHEFFPSEHWSYYGSPNHNGKSKHNYLTATPPNLGEVENPLQETRAANIILKFNGYWGTYGKYNDPPPGPTLHKNWTYPADSSLCWKIGWSLGY